MTYRKLSRAIAVVALGVAALIAFPASATAQPVDEAGNLADLCSGAGDGYTATVNLFQTSAVGGFVEASGFIETPDGSTLQVTGFTDGDLIFDDGTIDIVLTLVNDETQDPAGSATVSGTYTVSGRPTRVHEVINEGEQIVVSVGTHTPLSMDLTLEYADTTIPLECADAFAFEHRVIRQPIGTPL
jgi:hypothetical protein